MLPPTWKRMRSGAFVTIALVLQLLHCFQSKRVMEKWREILWKLGGYTEEDELNYTVIILKNYSAAITTL